MSDSAETEQILVEARALLAKRRGWMKGGYNTDKERFCMSGALWHVMGTFGTFDSPPYRLLCQVTGEPYLSPWNDEPSRRKSHVLAAFDEAIALSRRNQLSEEGAPKK